MSTHVEVSYSNVIEWLKAYAATIAENRQYLTELDSAIGDADHGINMDRGFQAVLGKIDSSPSGQQDSAASGQPDSVASGQPDSAASGQPDSAASGDIGGLFKTVGMTLVSTVGGAGGPLYGTLFLQLGIPTSGKDEITAEDWSAALDAAVSGVQARGKAELGDKTMIDALIPARDAFAAAIADGAELPVALRRSADAAEEGMTATIPLVARKGRASYLGERSAGHQDPGATSSYLLLRSLADAWAGDA